MKCLDAQAESHYSDFLGNFRSTIFLVYFAPYCVSLTCSTQSAEAFETHCPAQNILRNPALLQFPRKSVNYCHRMMDYE